MSDTGGPDSRLAELPRVVNDLRKQQDTDVAVVLVGSGARGTSSEASDIDLLLIGEIRPKIRQSLAGYHLQFASEADFVRNLAAGEDFEAWSVRLGKPLHDCGIWARIKSSPAAETWPKWQTKVVHAIRRLLLARMLFEAGDLDAAAEETLYALGHISRSILLRSGVFPLSRPELADQVREAGFPHLAEIHEQLRTASDMSARPIRLGQLYAKKLLCHLDPQTYRTYTREYRRNRDAKKALRAVRQELPT